MESFLSTGANITTIAAAGANVFEAVQLNDDLSRLRNSLPNARLLIAQAEWGRFKDKDLAPLLSHLKDTTYDAEGLLREFDDQELRQKMENADRSRAGQLLYSSLNLAKRLIHRSKARVKETQSRLDKAVAQIHGALSLLGLNVEQVQHMPETSSVIGAPEVLGRDEERDLIEMLGVTIGRDHEVHQIGDVLIPTLMIGDCSERICVRVSRFWDFFDPHDETKLLHTDLVLIDEEGNSVHAQIYPRLDEQFRPLIKEGGVYNISYFRVKKSNKYKPVTNDIVIIFTRWTLVEEVVEIPPTFSVCTYSLTPMEQLQSCVDCNNYFIDVIGVITMISNVSTLRARSRQTDNLKRTITVGNAGNATIDVVLWGERATSFPGEQVHKDGQASPQVVIFVGTLVKRFADKVSLTGGSACKWYINPEVPEAKGLMARVRSMHEPIKWDEHMTSGEPKAAAEPKKVSDIKYLHPFKNKKKEFLVTVTVRKIDNSWWYNSCNKCLRTTKPHGDSYRCTGPDCGIIGAPTLRYKLCIIAGDETGDTEFILFGRTAQRLTKKTVDTLIADKPRGFIPDEITRLLEKIYIWNVSFTENTIGSSNVCFQVNAVIREIDASNALLPMTPAGSQSSSHMLSQGASSSMRNTPQKSAPLALPLPPATSEASHASSPTPSKETLLTHEPPVTPQSAIDTTKDEKGQYLTLLQTKTISKPISVVVTLAESPETPQDSGGANVLKTASDIGFGDSTKTQGTVIGKRSRSAPKKNTAKKHFKDDIARDGDGDACADDTAKPRSTKDA